MIAVKILKSNGKYAKIGYIDEGVFKKKVRRDKHYCRIKRGWGIDKRAFNEVIKIKCSEIRIFDHKYKVLYTSSVENFEQNSTEGEFRNEGKQLFLELKYFELKNMK